MADQDVGVTPIRAPAATPSAERGETYAPGYVDPYSSAGADVALPPAQTWLLRTGKRAGP